MCCRILIVAALVAVLPSRVWAQEPLPPEPSSRLFTALAATFAGLNALDVVTTERVVQTGRGQEGNPAMALAVRNPYVFSLTKAVVTASMIVAVRRMSRQHRVRGIVFLIAADVGYGLIVAHNARVGAAVN